MLALAQRLVADFPDSLHLLVGAHLLPAQTKRSVVIELILVTDKALFVALDANAKRRAGNRRRVKDED